MSKTVVSNLVGIIPAAGSGTRLHPYRLAKELISVGFRNAHYNLDGPQERVVPKVVAEYTLFAMRQAGVRNVFIVVSESKHELLKFFGNGNYHNLNFSYLCQETPKGMPAALDIAFPWVEDKTVLMGMPDTILKPFNCFEETLKTHNHLSADLTLGVFPTDKPQYLAPVEVHSDSKRVLSIEDKPKHPKFNNSWGIAVWGSRFSLLMHEYCLEKHTLSEEVLLTDVFNTALEREFRVFAEVFPTGYFHDVGTPTGIQNARKEFEFHATL